MELQSVALFLLVILVTKFFLRKKLKLPPGPMPWPLIGNINLMSSLPHLSLHELSKKYGPLMQLQFGSFPVVVGSNVEMAKIVLKTMDENFATRYESAAGKYTGYNYSNLIWSPYGGYWKHARKLCSMEIFNARKLQSWEHIRVQEQKSFVKKIFKSSGKVIVLQDYLATRSLSVTSHMLLGKNYFDGSYDAIMSAKEFKEMGDDLFVLAAIFNIGDYIPCIDFLDLQGQVKRMKSVSKKLDRLLEYVVCEHEERKKKSDNYVNGDFVDVLLEWVQNPTLGVKLERQGVKGIIQDLLAGGGGSSKEVLEWAIAELLLKPELFEKATEELNVVLGQNRWPSEETIPKLPYIDAIIKETLRLHALAPISRLAREDCKVGEYDIKKGTIVVINAWTIGRDPSIWENPNEFCPERFLGRDDIDIKGSDMEMLPFGSGRRMCPGYSLGLKLLHVCLADLLHGFNWRLPDNMTRAELNMEEVFSLSMPKKIPLKVVAEPRLPVELYSF